MSFITRFTASFVFLLCGLLYPPSQLHADLGLSSKDFGGKQVSGSKVSGKKVSGVGIKNPDDSTNNDGSGSNPDPGPNPGPAPPCLKHPGKTPPWNRRVARITTAKRPAPMST
jgi:hypothetical protein